MRRDEDFHEREIKRGKSQQLLSCFEKKMKIERGGGKPLTLLLNYEFNRITSFSKKDTRDDRLVKRNSFISNTKVHSIHNK